MSAPTSPDDRAVGPPERLHPLYLLSGLTGSLRRLGGGYALIAWLAVSKGVGTALVAAVALFAVGVVGVALYWTRFEFRVGDDEIRIDQGILSRTHRSIPFDRIQDVDISQGPLQRLLGLARVTFETGGGSAGRGSEEGALQAITLDRAEEIRRLVRSRRSHAVKSTQEKASEGDTVYALTIPRLLLAGIFNFSLAIFAALVGLTQTLGDAIGFDPFSESFWRQVLSAGDPFARYAEQHRFTAIAAGAILLVVIGLGTGVVRTFIREFGFRLDRTEVGLRRRRGLLTRTDVTLPVKRAQAVVIVTGPVRDRFGWRELKLQSLAQEEDGKGDHVLAPLATNGEVNGIVSRLGWAPIPDKLDWRHVARSYVTQFVVGISPLFLAMLVQAAVFWPFSVAYALAALMLIVVRWLGWHRTMYALDGDRLLIRRGWWRRSTTLLPISKIQSVDLTENFVTRWFGTARLTFGVAGGGVRGHSIPAIPRSVARQLRDELLDISA